MILRSRPVRFLITRVARAYGFLDPVALLAHLRGFAKPSEVAEPIELLRAGMLFHARGLVNTKAIQNNLDWVWPYWVERQFNPGDPSFIPRAFSFSHINLTHRNWTAVGVPDVPYYPIVDPRGLVTPLFDGWSLDFWFAPEEGPLLLPSKLADFQQELSFGSGVGGTGVQTLQLRSVAQRDGVALESVVALALEGGEPRCRVQVRVQGSGAGAVVVALRPYNPEGVSSVKEIAVLGNRRGWLVNGRNEVMFDREPAKHLLSTYAEGDVGLRLRENLTVQGVKCPVSMATAIAWFPVTGRDDVPCEVTVPIYNELEPRKRPVFESTQSWSDALTPLARLRVPDPAVQRLYDLAIANLVLHSPGEVYPGPYTYKRFWFRDAVFILNALLSLGGVERTRRALREFAPRQRMDGYFLSQEGEWDSNGEALWFYHRFATLAGETLPADWLHAMAKGARWITRKRLPLNPARPEAGLLPAGFSAEHLGPNDFYYWDDFWAVAGLRAAGELLRETDPTLAQSCTREAEEFLGTIQKSFPVGPHRRFPGAIPASPHRRMDSGAVGSLVADYPLQLFPPGDSWVTKTADYLCDHCLHAGGFFQNMIHSGINAYLTLHLAQVRLRAGDAKAAWALVDRVVALASPTGQWPEAIHPGTLGGCMGDGQHIWAAAEWLMLVRNLFVREEGSTLVIGAGVRAEWLVGAEVDFGPTLTPFGPVTVRLVGGGGTVRVNVDGNWRGTPPVRELRVPGYKPITVAAGNASSDFELELS
ncbi:MAG TPA: hypothetical protein VEQ65_08705 [Opitutus sp.]|nr:hypothetical protein [Opitutus sp.]